MGEEVIDAATRKLRRLMAEAEGAQHNSIAAKALAQFNRELAADYAAANTQAEAEEGTKFQATAEAELEAMPATDEDDDEPDEVEKAVHHLSHSRRPKR